jgi:hypothetical protein
MWERELLKKYSIAAAILVSLVILLSGLFVVKANYPELLPGYPSSIYIESPQNLTYNEGTISINFTVESYNQEPFPTVYMLNGEEPVRLSTGLISNRTVDVQVWDGWSSSPNQTVSMVIYTLSGNAVLKNLADGSYNLTIQRFLSDEKTLVNSTKVSFTVDSKPFATAPLSVNHQITELPIFACIAVGIIPALIAILTLLLLRHRQTAKAS